MYDRREKERERKRVCVEDTTCPLHNLITVIVYMSRLNPLISNITLNFIYLHTLKDEINQNFIWPKQNQNVFICFVILLKLTWKIEILKNGSEKNSAQENHILRSQVFPGCHTYWEKLCLPCHPVYRSLNT